MNDDTPRKPGTDLSWTTLGSQLRFYRLMLVIALSLVGLHATTAGWAHFRSDPGVEVAAAGLSPRVDQHRPGPKPKSTSDIEPQRATTHAVADPRTSPDPAARQRFTRPRQTPWRADRAVQATVRIAGKQLGRNLTRWQHESRASWQSASEALGASVVARTARLLRRQELASAPEAALPIASTAKAAPPAQRPSARPPTLVLTNPAENGGPVGYLLNGQEHRLRPGQSQQLSRGASWRIEFHRGAHFGKTAYTLEPGDYEFEVTPRGWELYPE